MTAAVVARGLGVEFLFDRQRRLVSPTLARIRARRTGTTSWGLRELDLEIGGGEAVALVGRSGGGKTTLLRTIAGVLAPDAGTIRVDGPCRGAALRRRRRDGRRSRVARMRSSSVSSPASPRARRGARRRACRRPAASATPSTFPSPATRRECGRGSGSPPPTRPIRRSCSSTRCTRRSITTTALWCRSGRARSSPAAGSSLPPGTTTRCWSSSPLARSGSTRAGSSPMDASRRSAPPTS